MAYSDNISRLSRLTAILLKLQSRTSISVKNLAQEFKVSTRTIYRDLTSLEQAGVPLVEDGKGYALMEGYVIPPVMFTETEANALIVAEKIINKSQDRSLINAFAKAIEKIKSVLGHAERQKASFLSERTIIGKNWENKVSSSFLTDLQQALTHFSLVEIAYKKTNDIQASSRKVEPFAIYFNTNEHWILIAWCRLREDFRTFRVDRISHMKVLPETFPPHEMGLEEYVEMQRIKYSHKE